MILALLSQVDEGLALREIRAQLDSSVNERQLQQDLVELRNIKLVRLTGRGRGARWERV